MTRANVSGSPISGRSAAISVLSEGTEEGQVAAVRPLPSDYVVLALVHHSGRQARTDTPPPPESLMESKGFAVRCTHSGIRTRQTVSARADPLGTTPAGEGVILDFSFGCPGG